jgi:hypothetical protein
LKISDSAKSFVPLKSSETNGIIDSFSPDDIECFNDKLMTCEPDTEPDASNNDVSVASSDGLRTSESNSPFETPKTNDFARLADSSK